LILGEAVRVVAGFGWFFGGNTGNERSIFVQPRPRSLVDDEVMEPGAAERRLVGLQLRLKRGVAAPDLAQEDVVHQFRRFYYLVERFAIAGGKAGSIGADVCRSKSGDHFFEFCLVRALLRHRRCLPFLVVVRTLTGVSSPSQAECQQREKYT